MDQKINILNYIFKFSSKFSIEIQEFEFLLPFKNEYEFQTISFDEFISNIRRELENINYYETHLKYINFINKMKDPESLFKNIFKMKMCDGFFSSIISRALMESDKISLQRIKFSYITLLMAFEYFKNYEIELNNQEINLQKSGFISEELLSKYETTLKKNRICTIKSDKYIYTTKKADNLLEKNISCSIRVNWDINIPNYILKNEGNLFCSVDEDVILKNGSILNIFEISKNEKNFYEIKCKLSSYSFESYVIRSFKKLDITELNLSYSELGCNLNFMILLKDVLSERNNIKILNLSYNIIGEDVSIMEILKQIIFSNEQIMNLNLEYNEIGYYSDSINVLKLLLINSKINILNLAGNHFGENYQNFKILKDIILAENFLSSINISNNDIGRYSESVRILFILFLDCCLIKEIDFSQNCISENDLFYFQAFREYKHKEKFSNIK